MQRECEVCGNMIEVLTAVCPFCGHRTENPERCRDKRFIHKTLNLEDGRPTVEVALHRMNEWLEDGARNGVSVITLIHGYGSSGKGGVIRLESRKMLDLLKNKGRIADFIPGEDFTRRSGKVKSLLRRYPRMSCDRNLNKGNRGITLVIISY